MRFFKIPEGQKERDHKRIVELEEQLVLAGEYIRELHDQYLHLKTEYKRLMKLVEGVTKDA